MAEVKLVIDNSAGKIPVPMSEIEIARTIFRSGDSEYRIGGQVVRLMDVQELLSESRIGRALHTVVGQGQLEEVLLSKPEDRRKYIEEAAGIAKHRRRKERAERKLGGLDQDLLRLSDVLAELRRQLKPLQQQAEMAEATRDPHGRSRPALANPRRRAGSARWSASRSAAATAGIRVLVERSQAAERLDALDEQVLAAADARAAATRALTESEQVVRATTFDARWGGTTLPGSQVDREAAARTQLASKRPARPGWMRSRRRSIGSSACSRRRSPSSRRRRRARQRRGDVPAGGGPPPRGRGSPPPDGRGGGRTARGNARRSSGRSPAPSASARAPRG